MPALQLDQAKCNKPFIVKSGEHLMQDKTCQKFRLKSELPDRYTKSEL